MAELDSPSPRNYLAISSCNYIQITLKQKSHGEVLLYNPSYLHYLATGVLEALSLRNITMATSVELVQIRDLKKGRILTTIQKNKQLYYIKSLTI